MYHTTRMVLIPEQLYLKLIGENKNLKDLNVKNTKKITINPNVEDLPISQLLDNMKSIKNNNSISDEVKDLKYNQDFKKMNKIFKDKFQPKLNMLEKNPVLKKDFQNNNSFTTPLSNSFVTTEQQNKSIPITNVFNTPPNKNVFETRQRRKEKFNYYESPLSTNEEKYEEIINYLKNNSNSFPINDNLQVLNKQGNILKKSNVNKILGFHFISSKKGKPPIGYKELIPKLLENKYLKEKYFKTGGGTYKTIFAFKPLLWEKNC